MIALVLDLASYTRLGNRSLERILHVISRYVPGMTKVPCHGTIRLWKAKRAVYDLTVSPKPVSDCPEGDKWALMLDISLEIGGRRILLALGVNLTTYDHAHALTLSDIKVLAVGMRELKGWKADDVETFVRDHVLCRYQIAYIVTDGGPNLVRAALQLGIIRVDDIGHGIARKLRTRYSQELDFERLMKKATHLRRYNTNNDFHGYRPPRVRSKARFMNLAGFFTWAKNMLTLLDGGYLKRYPKGLQSHSHRNKLLWLIEYRDLVNELYYTFEIVNQIMGVLKTDCLCTQNAQYANQQLDGLLANKYMRGGIREYLKSYLTIHLEYAKSLKYERIICTTDIIETCFGHYKEQTPAGAIVVNLHCLQLAAYDTPVQDYDQVNAMITHTRVKDLPNYLNRTVGSRRTGA